MTMVKVSIPKNNDGAGCAIPKDPTIILIDAQDVDTEPTRTAGNVVTTGDLELKEGTKAIGIYATPVSIEDSTENTGDMDAKGFKQKMSFEHPGDSNEINNFIEGAANRQFLILVKQCDGTAAGRTKLYGSKCNPLSLTTENTDNKDAAKKKLTFAQEITGKFLPGIYGGAMPELAAAAAATQEGA